MDVNKILADIDAASKNTFSSILNTFDTMNITTTTSIKAERLQICQMCDMFESGIDRCKECGCFMQVKAAIKHARCPLNRW